MLTPLALGGPIVVDVTDDALPQSDARPTGRTRRRWVASSDAGVLTLVACLEVAGMIAFALWRPGLSVERTVATAGVSLLVLLLVRQGTVRRYGP